MAVSQSRPSQITPIIVPIHVQRDCIVVEGRKYCEDIDVTPRQVGVILLLAALVLGYAIFALTKMHEDWDVSPWWSLGLPFAVLCIALIVWGGR